MKLPVLYHKGKSGELRQWRAWADGEFVYTEYGTVGGQLQISRKKAEPRNIGRTNSTSPQEQAILEARSLWQFKIDRKYSDTKEGAMEQLFLPMLAHKFNDRKATYPGYLQPKMDGLRCLASRVPDGSIALTSRAGKPWSIPGISAALSSLPEDTVLDGEIYIHGTSCQRITSLAKSAEPSSKSHKPESVQLEYHIYDIPQYKGDDTLIWEERFVALCDTFSGLQNARNIVFVPTTTISKESELWDAHDQWVKEGYEGAIWRNPGGTYYWGYRSSDLLKIKRFDDSEFRVINIRDGRGKMEGRAVFICQNELTNDTFECTMKTSMDERELFFIERHNYIGRMLTVRYFGRTDDQKPRFPVGIMFREDL